MDDIENTHENPKMNKSLKFNDSNLLNRIPILESILKRYDESREGKNLTKLFKSVFKKTSQLVLGATPTTEVAGQFKKGIDKLKEYKDIVIPDNQHKEYLPSLDQAANILSDIYQNLDEAKKDIKFSNRIKKLEKDHQTPYFENIERTIAFCGDVRKNILNEMREKKILEINILMKDLSPEGYKEKVTKFEAWKDQNFTNKEVGNTPQKGVGPKGHSR